MNSIYEGIHRYAVYLEELRRRLLTLTKLFVVVFIGGFLLTPSAITFIMKVVKFEGVTIVTTSPFQLIDLAMSVGFFFGCIATVPVFLFFLYSFLKPALLPRERGIFFFILPLGFLLFALGFLYSSSMLYFAIKTIAVVNTNLGVANYWDINNFISQIVLTSSLFGLLFLAPMVVTFLIRVGIMNVSFLRSKRRHAIAIIFVIVSLLPPTDGLSLILMVLPMILMFEITLLLNSRVRNVT